MNLNRLRSALVLHEGLELKPYTDTEGKLTIGVGRNLSRIGISEGEAMTLLENDITRAVKSAVSTFPWFEDLDEVRQEVLVNMIFNVGVGGVRNFKKMIAALEKKDYALAAAEMLDSRWAAQTGERARELSAAMRTGSFEG